MIKAVFLLYRRPEFSRAEFLDYWRNSHAALAVKHKDGLGIRSYVQVHPVDDPMGDMVRRSRGAREADFDGIAEVIWDSVEAMAAVGETTAEIATAILADEASFVDLNRSIMFFGTPKQFIPVAPGD